LKLDEHLRPLSELGTYDIEKGDADPRGWTVVGAEGRQIGEVDDLIVDTQAMKVRYLVVELDDNTSAAGDSRVLLDASQVDVDSAQRQVRARGYGATGFGASAGAFAYRARERDGRDDTRLTRSEEELHIGTREVARGEVRVGKHVETEHVRQPVTTRREEIVVERRPVEAGARADASIGEDEVRIPLMEEELVVEKRAVVKEELVVGKRVVEEHDVVETEVRREEFDIDEQTTATSRDGGYRSESRKREDR
jgi:uncharacterized protein (TIGR02271 family)